MLSRKLRMESADVGKRGKTSHMELRETTPTPQETSRFGNRPRKQGTSGVQCRARTSHRWYKQGHRYAVSPSTSFSNIGAWSRKGSPVQAICPLTCTTMGLRESGSKHYLYFIICFHGCKQLLSCMSFYFVEVIFCFHESKFPSRKLFFFTFMEVKFDFHEIIFFMGIYFHGSKSTASMMRWKFLFEEDLRPLFNRQAKCGSGCALHGF